MSELHVGSVVSVAGVVLIPVEQVVSLCRTGKKGYWVHGSKEPTAIVVCDESGASVYDVAGGDTSLSDILRQVPGLKAVLEEYGYG